MRTLPRRLHALLLAALLIGAAPLAALQEPEADESEAPQAAPVKEEASKPKWDVTQPPGEWLTVSLDTEETTWSNVDVSPDGKTLAFDMLGDLYTVPIEGGEATVLASGVDWSIEPRYSPDGSKIAFVSDRGGGDNLWVMNADGSDPRVVSEEKEHLVHNPAWSPDGQYLAAQKGFTSTRSLPAGEIWLFHVGGGGGLQLIERRFGAKDQKFTAEPAFSPDGRYVYFTQDTTPGPIWQYNRDAIGQIYVIQRLDRETGEVEVFADGPGGAVRPTPSPDGRRLAFVKRTPAFTSALYVKELDSGKEWPLYDRLDRDLQEANGGYSFSPAFAWTPDGEALVFWAGGKLRRAEVATRQTSVIPVRVRAEMKVQPALRFPVEVAPESFRVRMPRWAQMSPDGTRVVFQALGRLWIRDLESGRQRRLTSQEDHVELYPSFSRDGRWLVYTTWDDQELGRVRVIPVRGGPGRVLTPAPGHYVEPRFSPDGSKVVYRKITGGYLLSPLWSMEPGIYVVPVAGGEPKRVVDSGSNAHFGAAEDRIFFSEEGQDNETLLKSVDLDGLDERTHLKGGKVTELSISPDGRWVAFTEQFNAYVAPFTATGKTVEVSAAMKSMPLRQVSKRSGEFLHWSAGSDELHWSHGATLYSRQLKDAFDFLDGAPGELPEPVTEGLDLSFEMASDRPAGVIALVGGRVVTMRGAREGRREVIEDGVVVVRGHRIEAVGAAGEVAVPEEAFVLDIAGKTVIPGLVDVHAHGSMGREEIIPEQSWMQLSNLAFGVTTLHDPSNDTTEVFAAAELQKAGMLVAPRIFSTGTILYGAHVPGYTAVVESYEDALFHVRRLKEVGAIAVKSYQQPRRDQRQQLIAAGRELGVMVVPEGGARFQHNMTEIVDGHTGIEHALPLVDAYEDVRQLWSQTEVGYTPTFGVAYGGLAGEVYWYDRTEVWKNPRLMRYSPRFLIEPRSIRRTTAPDEQYNHFHVARLAKALSDRGVSVQIGAHGQREGLAAHWEMWMMEQGGFTPWQALRGATLDGAWYLEMDHEIGSLETGKLADLVVVDGNPLEDLRRSEWVAYTMLNGRLYEAATMDQIAPDKVKRQPLFFELEGGDTIHPATRQWLREKQVGFGWVH